MENLERLDLESDDKVTAIDHIIDYGQGLVGNEDRIKLLKHLGDALSVDYSELNATRLMGLISASELEEIRKQDIDIQLHTHRHNFPLDNEIAQQEIDKNREKVDPLLDSSMSHFCYPSGLWSQDQAELLARNQIVSATTCVPGLAGKNENLYAIPRFLDGSNISEIEFESEIAGFAELCRRLKSGAQLKSTQ